MTKAPRWASYFMCMAAASLTLSGCGGDGRGAGAAPEPSSPPPVASPPATNPPEPPPVATPADPETKRPELPPAPTKLQARQVKAVLEQVGDWALVNPDRFDASYWAMAPLYDGLIDASLMTGDAKYLAAVMRAGQCVNFESGSRLYHADGHAAGRSWLRIYQMMQPKQPQLLDPWVRMFDRIVADPIVEEWVFGDQPPEGRRRTDRWVWTDALYMSPPTIVLLAQITGDARYLEFMDAEYAFAYKGLYDPDEQLLYRDARYIEQRTPSGEKVLWSRGNGWVYAGLALVLDALPEKHPTRDFYVDLFKKMTKALLKVQQPDGFWYPSLKDPQHAPTPETSGTALFVMGMAHGVRLGLLDAAKHWPAIERGWEAILSAVDEDGAVNSVQPPASWPDIVDRSSRVAYGTGAVLGAGAAILMALGEETHADPAALVADAQALAPLALDLSLEPDCKSAR